MAARPTTVQAAAIGRAIDNNRLGDATLYPSRTLDIMQRNGWVTRPDAHTYRITPEAARTIGRYTLADSYHSEDLLATDPTAQRQAAIIDLAHESGIHAFAQVGTTETVSISVEDLAMLLAATRSPAYAA